MLSLKVYIFSEQRDQTPIKMNGQDDSTSQNASVEVGGFYIQNIF